jgi:hypothetical protein
MHKNITECDSGIVFLSLARNCAKYMPALFELIAGVASQGVNVAAVIGENGSSDGTADFLAAMHIQNPNIVCVNTSFMDGIPSRLRRMAEGRQRLVRYAARHYPRAKYICVIDVDNVLEKTPSAEVLLESASRIYSNKSLFGVAATSDPYYYDISALRCSEFYSQNIYPEIMKAKDNLFGYFKFMKDNLFKLQTDFTNSKFRLCESAFNGLCIYRPIDYYTSSYLGDGQDDVCEHVILNHEIGASTGAKILVDERLVLAMPPEHGPQSLASFVGRRALKIGGLVS